jgi:hypothetical protein
MVMTDSIILKSINSDLEFIVNAIGPLTEEEMCLAELLLAEMQYTNKRLKWAFNITED